MRCVWVHSCTCRRGGNLSLEVCLHLWWSGSLTASKKSRSLMHRLLPATRVAGRRIANTTWHRNSFTPFLSQPHLKIAAHPLVFPGAPTHSSFHTSTPRRDVAPKSPFQVFREVLSEEIKKNRELEQNVAQLKGEVGKVQDSETLKQARQAYERARVEYLSSTT